MRRNRRMKELKDFAIHRESLRQMSKEQIKELNTQQGWFSNNIDDFRDFNTLNCCWYDGCNADNTCFWSFISESKWEYFLPCKSLQNLLEKEC